jgi:hypothetical protein
VASGHDERTDPVELGLVEVAALRPVFRLPLLFLGVLALATGVLGGLARLGWPVPSPAAANAGWHGALMISAFFGTVISLERAVALGHPLAYLAPALAGAGGLALLTGAPAPIAAFLLTGASVVLVVASAWVLKRQVATFTVVIALGALCWLLGNSVWLLAGYGPWLVPCWIAFLILTIAGERLELTRFLPTPDSARRLFLGIVLTLLLGMAGSLWREAAGLVLFSLGLLALAAWLLRYDIARRNVGTTGLTRFIALCLLCGYGWLAVGAGLGLMGSLQPGHPWRDPALHALTLGFVFSMVIGHALIVFPAVVRIKVPFRRILYLPLIALHLSLVVRVAGGLAGNMEGLRYGALGNALSMLLFFMTLASCAWQGRASGASGQTTSRA